MNTLLVIASLAEAGTGVVLLAYPPIVVRLLFGAEIVGAGVVMSRIAGISLIALSVACWPYGAPNRALSGMLTYSALAMLYLAYLGFSHEWIGILLWPGVVVHAGLSALLVRAWVRRPKTLGPMEETNAR